MIFLYRKIDIFSLLLNGMVQVNLCKHKFIQQFVEHIFYFEQIQNINLCLAKEIEQHRKMIVNTNVFEINFHRE